MKKLILPQNIINILSAINDNGYEAYVVGGAVRDFLLGKQVSDYDITTNAFLSISFTPLSIKIL